MSLGAVTTTHATPRQASHLHAALHLLPLRLPRLPLFDERAALLRELALRLLRALALHWQLVGQRLQAARLRGRRLGSELVL